MTDKEINRAILDELYKVADEVWAKMAVYLDRSVTASEVVKSICKEIKWGDVDPDEKHTIEVDAFRCEFSNRCVFELIARFEKLASVGSKKRLFAPKQEGEELGRVTFLVDAEFRALCDFVGKDKDAPGRMHVFIDCERDSLVATDGYKLMVQPTTMTEKTGDTSGMMIPAADFGKLCRKMKGKKVYHMTARKVKDGIDERTVVEFDGILSRTEGTFVFPRWACAFRKASKELRVDILDWQDVRKFAKARKKSEYIRFTGKQGEDTITLSAEGASVRVTILFTVKHSFSVLIAQSSVMAAPQSVGRMSLYLEPMGPCASIIALGSNHTLYVFSPVYDEEGGSTYVGEKRGDVLNVPNVDNDVDLLQMYAPLHESIEPKKQDTTKKDVKRTTAKKQTAQKNADTSRKFTFAAVGITPGIVLTFAPTGAQVTAIGDNKVEYQGATYTLSGYCKAFMPDEKRSKSNSYRGCAFFTYQGTKLEKLFKEATGTTTTTAPKAPAAKTEAIENTPGSVAVQIEEKQTSDLATTCADTEVEKMAVQVETIRIPVATSTMAHVYMYGVIRYRPCEKSPNPCVPDLRLLFRRNAQATPSLHIVTHYSARHGRVRRTPRHWHLCAQGVNEKPIPPPLLCAAA